MVDADGGGCWWLELAGAGQHCCLRRWLLELAGGGEGWWCRLLLLVVAAAVAVLPFDLMHFAILNLILMYVEYFICLLITNNVPSFTLFLFFKLDIHTHLFTHVLFLFHT